MSDLVRFGMDQIGHTCYQIRPNRPDLVTRMSDLVIRVTRLAGVSCGDGRTAAMCKAPLPCRSGRLIMLVMHLVYVY